MREAAIRIRSRPVSVLPVNTMRRTCGASAKRLPTRAPEPVTRFTTPGGSVSAKIPAARPNANGANVEGLTTTGFPAINAGAIIRNPSVKGEFHGTITAVTPTGWRR